MSKNYASFAAIGLAESGFSRFLIGEAREDRRHEPFVEGCLLIVFQRLNWQDWGRMLHVSAPIIWISSLADVLLFGAAACVILAVAKIFPNFPLVATTVFCLSFLTAYDWLTCIGRLQHWSCLLLAIGLASVFTRWAGRNEIRALRFWRRTVPALIGVLLVAFATIHLRSAWRERREIGRLPPAAAGALFRDCLLHRRDPRRGELRVPRSAAEEGPLNR